MKKKYFTEEEKRILGRNRYVKCVYDSRLAYEVEFKKFFFRSYHQGRKPSEIFKMCGFDTKILGSKRIERAAARWRKIDWTLEPAPDRSQ